MPGAKEGLPCLGGFSCICGGVPAHTLCIAKAYAAVRAGEDRPQDEPGGERGAAVTDALFPCQDQRQGEWHCLAFIICLHLLCVGCVQEVNKESHGNALHGKVLCLHEVQKGEATGDVAEERVDCEGR